MSLELRNRVDRNSASSGRKLRFKQADITTEAGMQTIQYTYDALARLQAADYYEGDNLSAAPTRQYTYAYDPAGNRTKQIMTVSGTQTITDFTYSAANQLTGDGTNTYSYDDNGNMTGDGTNTFTWDRANRLLTHTGSTYTYNGLGQRVSQTVSSVVTEYLLDVQPGLYKVIAATASGSTDRFIHDPMGIAQHEDNSGNWHWMAKDGLGTVRGVYDDTLTEAYTADRDPYGNLIASTGSNPTPFEYTGEPEDQNGLLHLRARYYDPSLAVFNSLDPLETPNRYAYVNGDPVNRTDSTGLIADEDLVIKDSVDGCTYFGSFSNSNANNFWLPCVVQCADNAGNFDRYADCIRTCNTCPITGEQAVAGRCEFSYSGQNAIDWALANSSSVRSGYSNIGGSFLRYVLRLTY